MKKLNTYFGENDGYGIIGYSFKCLFCGDWSQNRFVDEEEEEQDCRHCGETNYFQLEDKQKGTSRVKIYPMFEKNGCQFYGSGSFEHAYFDTEKGHFRIIEVLDYYDVPLLLFVRDENGQVYFASICWELFDRSDLNREWAYVLVLVTDEEGQQLKQNQLEIDVPFLKATKGYRIVVSDHEEEKDTIQEVNPSDEESYSHMPGHVFLNGN